MPWGSGGVRVPPPGGGVPGQVPPWGGTQSGTPPGTRSGKPPGGYPVRYPPGGGSGYLPPRGVRVPPGGYPVRYPPGGSGYPPEGGSGYPPGGVPGQVPPPGGGSGTPPGGTRSGGGVPGQDNRRSTDYTAGRYASCVHAGGLSCLYLESHNYWNICTVKNWNHRRITLCQVGGIYWERYSCASWFTWSYCQESYCYASVSLHNCLFFNAAQYAEM